MVSRQTSKAVITMMLAISLVSNPYTMRALDTCSDLILALVLEKASRLKS